MYLPEPFVHTDDQLTEFKLNLLNLKKGELLIDLGCGNAHVLIKACQLAKIRGVGYELREEAIHEARQNIAAHNLEDQITIKEESFYEADVSQADAVFMYLTRFSLGELSLKLEQELKPGTRVITHDFDIPAWTEKEKHIYRKPSGVETEVFLYEV